MLVAELCGMGSRTPQDEHGSCWPRFLTPTGHADDRLLPHLDTSPETPAPMSARRSSRTTPAATCPAGRSPAVIRVPTARSWRYGPDPNHRRRQRCRRRQGRRGGDHEAADRLASTASGRTGAVRIVSRKMRRSAGRGPHRHPTPAAACYTLDGQGPIIDVETFSRPGDRHDPRQEHPPFDCQGQDGQRGPPPAISWLASRATAWRLR